MNHRFLLAILAVIVVCGCQVVYAQPPKHCGQLISEVMTKYAQEGAAPIGATGDQLTGAERVAYLNFTSNRGYIDMVLPSGQPPPPGECPTTLVLVGECVKSRPTGEQATYKYWSCSVTAPVTK